MLSNKKLLNEGLFFWADIIVFVTPNHLFSKYQVCFSKPIDTNIRACGLQLDEFSNPLFDNGIVKNNATNFIEFLTFN